MAFDKKQLVLVEAYHDRQVWRYDTADAVGTVITAGYIADGDDLGLKVGDTVKIRVFADVTTKASLTSETEHRVTVVGASTTALDGGSVLLSSTTGVLGYIAGAGGTVTQATNKSTGVTLNRPTGQITMNNAALNLDVAVSFTLTNTVIGANDLLVLNHISGGTAGSYTLNAQCAAGSAIITVRNVTAGNLSEAIVISFAVVRGAIA